MTRYEAIEKALRGLFAVTSACLPDAMLKDYETALVDARYSAQAALALPEDSKTVNAELYDLAISLMDLVARNRIVGLAARDGLSFLPYSHYEEHTQAVLDAQKYLSLREASGDPMPYKVVRDGDKVRFE